MNQMMQSLLAHRSIRKFTDQTISAELLASLVACAQAAASSSFIQAASMIRITSAASRRAIADLAGNQVYVQSAAEFIVFCGDLKRSSDCCVMHDQVAAEGMTEHFIIATVDASLMAQNMVVAAESAGLGICYIGGIRNDPAQLSELLSLPEGVFPLFGLCLGYPDQDPEVKPRLPAKSVLMTDRYEAADEAELRNYDEVMKTYYATRTGNNKSAGWTEQMAATLSKEARPHMLPYLNGRGLLKR